jgi:hypothetical protein
MILSQLSEAHLTWCCRSNSGDYIIGIEIPLHHMGFSLDSRHLSGMRETARELSLEFWIPSASSEFLPSFRAPGMLERPLLS